MKHIEIFGVQPNSHQCRHCLGSAESNTHVPERIYQAHGYADERILFATKCQRVGNFGFNVVKMKRRMIYVFRDVLSFVSQRLINVVLYATKERAQIWRQTVQILFSLVYLAIPETSLCTLEKSVKQDFGRS